MVFEIAKLLKQNDHSPVLLHFGSSYVESFCTDQHIESHLIPHRRFYKKTVLLPLFAFKTKSFVKSLNLDCLHAHLFGPIVAFAPLAWMAKLPFVGTLHDVYMVEGSAHRAFLLKQALFFNAKLTTVSNPMREFYLKTLRCNEQDIVYIPNCTRINAHRDARLAVRYSLGLSEHTVALISVGRLVGLKRFNILIDAVAKLDERSSFKAFIVGDGPERSSLEALIVKYQLQDHVVMLGERSDVEMLLAASDIFSLTSETEGMSKSILEALAAGLPVVATDVGGNKDLVKHGDNGFLSQEHSSSEVRKFFSILINNAELRTRMGENSLALLKQEYNSDLFLKRHIEIYNNSIEKR